MQPSRKTTKEERIRIAKECIANGHLRTSPQHYCKADEPRVSSI